MLARLSQEVEVLRRRYPEVELDSGGGHVLIRNLLLPTGWNRLATDILVIVPPGYPATPPDNFFVPQGFRLANGQAPGNYSEGASLLGQVWGQFSFHSQEWNPTAVPCEGDSLLTYFALVERRLGELN